MHRGRMPEGLHQGEELRANGFAARGCDPARFGDGDFDPAIGVLRGEFEDGGFGAAL